MNTKSKLVRKRFKCIKCKGYESQLVNSTKFKLKCSNCGGLLNEITENEYKMQRNKNNVEDKKKNESIKVNKNNINNNSNTNNKIPSNKTTTYKGVKININANPNKSNNNSKNNIEKEKEKEKEKLKQKEEEEKLKERIEKEKERQKLRFKSSNHIENTKNQSNENNINQNNFFSNYLNNRNNNIRERNMNENINRENMLGDIFRGIYNLMSNGMNSESNEPQILSFQSDNNGPIIIRVNRHNINDDIYDQSFSHFGSNFNNNFRDNFSSNFRSNLGNFVTQLIEIVRRNREDTERKKNHPTKKEVLDKLKKFPMSTKYCKKINGNKFEFPQCCICLNDINKNEKTVLLPCGHMFHWDCCLKWLQSKNTCPVCRFELPAEDS